MTRNHRIHQLRTAVPGARWHDASNYTQAQRDTRLGLHPDRDQTICTATKKAARATGTIDLPATSVALPRPNHDPNAIWIHQEGHTKVQPETAAPFQLQSRTSNRFADQKPTVNPTLWDVLEPDSDQQPASFRFLSTILFHRDVDLQASLLDSQSQPCAVVNSLEMNIPANLWDMFRTKFLQATPEQAKQEWLITLAERARGQLHFDTQSP
jgi:hypothetical protein